jgi:hypothetical protein
MTILHTNDFHSAGYAPESAPPLVIDGDPIVGGFSRIAVISEIKSANPNSTSA